MPSTSKDRLETVLQRAPTPIIMLEMGTARVLFANEAAGAVAGGMVAPQDQLSMAIQSLTSLDPAFIGGSILTPSGLVMPSMDR